jgi:hypothetical protein
MWWRVGEVEIQLHSFTTYPIDADEQPTSWSALPPRKQPPRHPTTPCVEYCKLSVPFTTLFSHKTSRVMSNFRLWSRRHNHNLQTVLRNSSAKDCGPFERLYSYCPTGYCKGAMQYVAKTLADFSMASRRILWKWRPPTTFLPVVPHELTPRKRLHSSVWKAVIM